MQECASPPKEKEDRKLRMELAAQERERKIMAREDAIASSIRAYYTPKISSDAAKAVLIRVVKRFKEGSTRKKRELTFGRDWIKMHGLLSIISNTDDYRNIADAIDMANSIDFANLINLTDSIDSTTSIDFAIFFEFES